MHFNIYFWWQMNDIEVETVASRIRESRESR
jgi:hypothetical protein